VVHNPAGKPRKGSFEVTLDSKNEKEAVLLFSKLDEFGPAKKRDYIATSDAILTKLLTYYPKTVRKGNFSRWAIPRTSCTSTDLSHDFCAYIPEQRVKITTRISH
jgi:hypothetical protein